MIIHNPILTGSFTVNGTDVSSITSSAASLTSLNAYTASQNNRNGTYATTGSNTFAGIQTVNSNLVVTGSITAQTLVVQTITSSVDFVTGSTRFGSIAANTHVFTGSMSVSGSMQFSNSSTITTNAGTGFLAMYANGGGLYFGGAASTNHMMISSSGNVGIGTISPSRTLDITGTLRVVTPNRSFFITSNAYSISDGTLSSGIGMDGDGLYLGNVISATGWTISNPQVTIRSSGNVGIGTTSPVTFLHISGSNTTNRGQLCIQSNNVSNAARASWYYDTTLQGNIGTTSADFYIEAVNNLQFYAGGAERMRIDTNGLITAPYMTGKSFAMTSGGGTGTAITDTGIYVGSGDWGGFGRSTIYLVSFSANPNNGGSGEYNAVHVGYITVYTGWNGSNVTTYIAYTQLVQGNNIGTLTLYPTFWNGSSESASVTRGSISGWQIRIKISGYNSSYTGANQALYVQKILSNG
jgi:hypothetical protein